jgi:hypothetical protein
MLHAFGQDRFRISVSSEPRPYPDLKWYDLLVRLVFALTLGALLAGGPTAASPETDRLVADANTAFAKNDLALAKKDLEAALAIDPSLLDARMLVTMTSCLLGDKAAAVQHASKLSQLSAKRFEAVKAYCAAKGMVL